MPENKWFISWYEYKRKDGNSYRISISHYPGSGLCIGALFLWTGRGFWTARRSIWIYLVIDCFCCQFLYFRHHCRIVFQRNFQAVCPKYNRENKSIFYPNQFWRHIELASPVRSGWVYEKYYTFLENRDYYCIATCHNRNCFRRW